MALFIEVVVIIAKTQQKVMDIPGVKELMHNCVNFFCRADAETANTVNSRIIIMHEKGHTFG